MAYAQVLATLPLVVAASGLSQPIVVAAGGFVVVLAILLVFLMVLRSNGGARKTASGIGYDAQQGPLGQPHAPASQPDPRLRPDAAQPGWSAENPYGNFNAGGGFAGTQPDGRGAPAGWGAGFAAPPAGPQGGAGGRSSWDAQQAPSAAGWGEQAAPGAAAGWGAANGDRGAQWPEQGGWGATPAQPGAPAASGGNQAGWGAPEQPAPAAAFGNWGAQPSGDQNGWGQAAPSAGGEWGAAPAAGQGWGAPPAAPQNAGWGAGSAAPAGPSAYDMAAGGAVPFGAEADKTRVVRPPSQQRTAMLVVRQGKEPGRSFEIHKERLTIGRSRESDIFLEDLAVSRLHTTVAADGSGHYMLRDENSANGSYVNGQRVNEHQLEEGDEIQVGQTVLAFVRR